MMPKLLELSGEIIEPGQCELFVCNTNGVLQNRTSGNAPVIQACTCPLLRPLELRNSTLPHRPVFFNTGLYVLIELLFVLFT